MNKKLLSETDIRSIFITPAIKQASWGQLTQIREAVGFTKGRIIVRGKLVIGRNHSFSHNRDQAVIYCYSLPPTRNQIDFPCRAAERVRRAGWKMGTADPLVGCSRRCA
jgi:hypothetical protein